MFRHLKYYLIAVIAFSVSIFVVFSFYWNSDERFVNAQKGEASNSAKIITQNQTNTNQDDTLPPLNLLH